MRIPVSRNHRGVLRGKEGSSLIAVLWCLAILSVVVVSSLHAVRLELRGLPFGSMS